MFWVLLDIHLDLGTVRIILTIQDTIKEDPFSIYAGFGLVQIHFYRIRFSTNL